MTNKPYKSHIYGTLRKLNNSLISEQTINLKIDDLKEKTQVLFLIIAHYVYYQLFILSIIIIIIQLFFKKINLLSCCYWITISTKPNQHKLSSSLNWQFKIKLQIFILQSQSFKSKKLVGLRHNNLRIQYTQKVS